MGPGVMTWKGVRHPLHKEELDHIRQSFARQVSLSAGGQLIPPEAIVVMNAIQLDDQTAESHFPDDFKAVVDVG